MALSGAWLAASKQVVPEAGAQKWGNGVSSAFAVRGGPGRNIAPSPGMATVPDALTDPTTLADGYSYYEEDQTSALWGDNYQTGTADRDSWGQDTDRMSTGEFPEWGNRPAGVPGGTQIRAINMGADATNDAKVTPDEDVAQGWRNKVDSYVEDSTVSDESQYIVQTSMVQRDQVRAGSQAASGRANKYDAPINSRIPGMRARFWSGGQRHYDMQPKSQDTVIRPFVYRTAGTGYADWMAPNEMKLNTPLSRQPNADPYPGANTPDNTSGGDYTDEDLATW